jgi:hypothetical protein
MNLFFAGFIVEFSQWHWRTMGTAKAAEYLVVEKGSTRWTPWMSKCIEQIELIEKSGK